MTNPHRIALLCATERGRRFLQKLTTLSPESELTVFSFREEPWEPPFFQQLRAEVESKHHRFVEAKRIDRGESALLWDTTAFDLLLSVSWRYMVPDSIFRRATKGAFVFHDSLLPEYRGFSPTVWAIANGERRTGVTLFEMDTEVDAGPIVDQESIAISESDTIAEVLERVTESYLATLERNLPALLEGSAPRVPQDHRLATFCCKRMPEDNRIDWRRSAREVYNLIRALSQPYPGAYTTLDGKVLRIWRAALPPQERRFVGAIAGRVVSVDADLGATILVGDGYLQLRTVQLEGENVVNAAHAIEFGQTFV